MSKRMYERGSTIDSLRSLASEHYNEKYVFLNHKPIHPRWLGGMRFAFVSEAVAHGEFYYAMLTEYGGQVLAKRVDSAIDEALTLEVESGKSTL